MIPPILITGCARSGTSMTAGIIDRCGAFGGRTSGPNTWNPKGMYENDEVRDKIVKPWLTLMGADPMGQHPLPDINKLLPLGNLLQKVEQIMKYGGYQDGPWYYKGAKMCLVWPEWHKAFPDALWVIVRRKDEDIVYSCMRTAFMRAFRDNDGWQGWVDAHKMRFEEMKSNGLNVREVWPSKFIAGDFSEIQALISDLGMVWNYEAVKGFVSPELWGRMKDG